MDRMTRFALLAAGAFVLTACNLNVPASTAPAPTESAGLALRVELPGARTFSGAGELVQLQYVVTNTGTAPLAGPLGVVDEAAQASCPPLNETGNRDAFLDPGESVSCSGSYAVTQEDVNQGFVTRLAVASAGEARSNPAALTLSYQPETATAPPTPLPVTETATPQATPTPTLPAATASPTLPSTSTPVAALPTFVFFTTAFPTVPVAFPTGTLPPVPMGLPTLVLPEPTFTETATAVPSPVSLPGSPTAAPEGPTSAPVLPTETGLPVQEQDALAEAALRSLPKAEYTYLAPERMELDHPG